MISPSSSTATQKPQKPLPVVYLLTIVQEPERGNRWRSIVLTAVRGSEVLKRMVLESHEHRQDCIESFCAIAYRVFYYDEGADLLGIEVAA